MLLQYVRVHWCIALVRHRVQNTSIFSSVLTSPTRREIHRNSLGTNWKRERLRACEVRGNLGTAPQSSEDLFGVEPCIARQIVPHTRCSAFIAARPKKDGLRNDLNSFRTIGLESCALKMLTLLIDRRFRTWAKQHDIIPPSQNGFQDQLRTTNNIFILRCALDQTRAQLHIAFIDILNAFPSIHQPTLWTKLKRMGADGPIIRWMQLLYDSLRYHVRFQGSFSTSFTALAGVLIGDPASPFFWIFYMQDLQISTHSDDVCLDTVSLSHLEQADDIVLFTTSLPALQGKVDELAVWCSDNGMSITAMSKNQLICASLIRNTHRLTPQKHSRSMACLYLIRTLIRIWVCLILTPLPNAFPNYAV